MSPSPLATGAASTAKSELPARKELIGKIDLDKEGQEKDLTAIYT
jgi:hypothetical protein